jgi:predicted  nucleic acid-binding Zn-ribbon protein
VKRRQRSDSCFPVSIPDPQTTARLAQLEKELANRQESLTNLHGQFISMQKKYEDHIQELENRLRESRDEMQVMKSQFSILNSFICQRNIFKEIHWTKFNTKKSNAYIKSFPPGLSSD